MNIVNFKIRLLLFVGSLVVPAIAAHGKGSRKLGLTSFNFVSPAQSYQTEGTRVETGFSYSNFETYEKFDQNSPLDSRLIGLDSLGWDTGYNFNGFLLASDLPLVIGIKASGVSVTGSHSFEYGSTASTPAAADSATGSTSTTVAAAELNGYSYKKSISKIMPSLTYLLFDSLALGLEFSSNSISVTSNAYATATHSASVANFGILFYNDIIESGISIKGSEKALSSEGMINVFQPTAVTLASRLFMTANVTGGFVLVMTSNPAADDGEKSGLSAALSAEIQISALKLEEKFTFLQAFHENNGDMLARNVGGFQIESSADYNIAGGFSGGGGLSYMTASDSYSLGKASRQRIGLFFRTGYDF